MQSLARSLSFTGALTIAGIVGLLVVAAPQEKAPAEQGAMTLASSPSSSAKITGPPPAPITFADPDGQELILEDLSVRTAIHGMLSLTELEFRFRNPQSRVIEGRFSCTLPQNAAISRFAKEVNGQLMEGEVVERLRANQVYEQFLHQMRDPALLEQDQGNRFSARIFPIGANEPVRLLLSYTTLLPLRDGVRTYTLPLRGMSKVNKLTFRAFVTPIPSSSTAGELKTSTAEVTSFDQEDWTPDRDIVLTSRAEDRAPMLLRAGDFYVASLRPEVTAADRRPASSRWLFYVDTSASSAEGAQHRIRALEELLRTLPASDDVQLLAFDNEVSTLARGTASELSRSIGTTLRDRLFLGGTDIAGMLAHLAKRLEQDPSRTAVIASDLAATLGATASHEVQSSIAKLPANARVHVLVLGSREDAPTAKAIAAGRGRIVRVPFTDALATRAAAAVEELRRPLGGSVDVADAGAEWIYPTYFDDITPGDEVLVLGKVKAGEEPRLVASKGRRLDATTFAPLLEREAYRAYLEYLATRESNETSDAVRRALAAEQVKISIEQRVVIPRTTMLVLESEWDYQRFALDRRALAKILTIDAGGIGRLDRPPIAIAQRTETRKMRANASTAPPPPMATAQRSLPPPEVPASRGRESLAFMEVDAESGVEGGVEGGVVGGVPGGVIGGVADTVSEPIMVTAEAPMIDDGPMRVVGEGAISARPRPSPGSVASPPPTPLMQRRSADDERKAESGWLREQKPSRNSIASLEKKLENDPRDRETYNQLSEVLAAYDEWSALRRLALRWQPYDPENPQVYEVLGMAADALGNDTEAARAFASLIEIAPAKTELLQRAGLLLLRTRSARLAETPLRKALEVRPDRANGYRHLALMLWREGRYEEAARVLESATQRSFPQWYGGVQRVIREELGYVYRAWAKNDPSRGSEIATRAREHDVDLKRTDALRITLAWETDANDVDLHVVDPRGEECFYQHKATRSGLTLYEDITQGLGPEVVRTNDLERGTYHVGVRYFAAGPMGISRGLVIVLRDDDQLEIHPFRLTQGGGSIRYVAGVAMK